MKALFFVGFIFLATHAQAQAPAPAQEEDNGPFYTVDCSSYGTIKLENKPYTSVLLPKAASTKKEMDVLLQEGRKRGPLFNNSEVLAKDIPHISYETDTPEKEKSEVDDCINQQQKIIVDLSKSQEDIGNQFSDLYDWFTLKIDPRTSTSWRKSHFVDEHPNPDFVEFVPWVQVIDNRSGYFPKTNALTYEKGFISEEVKNSCTTNIYKYHIDLVDKRQPDEKDYSSRSNVFLVVNPTLNKEGCHPVSAQDLVSLMSKWKKEIETSKWKINTSVSGLTK